MLSQESPEIYEANTHIHIEPCIALRIHAAVRHSPTFYFDANQHIFSGVHHPGYIVCLGGCGKHHIALTLLCTALMLTPRSTDEAFKLSPRAFDLVGLIGIAKTKTSWKGGMGCKQTALHTFCIHIAKERLQKLQRDNTPLDSPDLLPLYSPPNISSVYKPIYAHLQVLPHNLHHFMHLISAPSSMP